MSLHTLILAKRFLKIYLHGTCDIKVIMHIKLRALQVSVAGISSCQLTQWNRRLCWAWWRPLCSYPSTVPLLHPIQNKKSNGEDYGLDCFLSQKTRRLVGVNFISNNFTTKILFSPVSVNTHPLVSIYKPPWYNKKREIINTFTLWRTAIWFAFVKLVQVYRKVLRMQSYTQTNLPGRLKDRRIMPV